ncbi:Non-homologous end-joining factor 1 like protein [Argiope bruennichi]|uniref:Non-homologous end-joining factor 1 n=1 Tax=Argiope bruennichi TaxID=94029 RepID=A0A8T0FI10_ARGBR|nr:Non-homologous end-joining factor 1 like protein [Argiope bruennichi]
MAREAYDEMWDLDWTEIPEFPYIMKYQFDEEGYVLMISDLVAIYGEKLNEKAIQERFQILNPYAEMLPKVILKHVKQSIKNILAGEQEHEKNKLKIALDSNKLIIQHEFDISGVRFVFNFEPQILSENQFKAHILRPTLLRALILYEEKADLQRKVEELEGKQSSSSNKFATEIDPPASGVIRAFLCLQKDKITLPESLEGTPATHQKANVSPTKGIHSSSISGIPHKRMKDSKSTVKNIPYEEGDSDVTLQFQNRIQQSKEREISIKIEENEADESKVDEFNNSSSNFITNAQNGRQTDNRLSSTKREIVEEDSKNSPSQKEESVSKPTTYLKPSPSKRKKILKF